VIEQWGIIYNEELVKGKSPGHIGGRYRGAYTINTVGDFIDSRIAFAVGLEDRRTLIRNYYSNYQAPSNCPPGLAKKNNGCQPPGQAKKWRRGEPLPQDVVYNDLPGVLIDQLGLTPEGNRIVQIDSELLLINIATGMVLDAFDHQQ
jgi:hypothetical protein